VRIEVLLRQTALLLVAVVVLRVAVLATRLQWDFRVYHAAARAALAGLDPYSLAALGAAAGRPIQLPFLYPPSGLVVFLPFAGLSFATAAAIWVGLKVLVLGGLVDLVRRTWLPGVDRVWIALVVVFGGAASAPIDLRSGNVALFETALLAAGPAAFPVRPAPPAGRPFRRPRVGKGRGGGQRGASNTVNTPDSGPGARAGSSMAAGPSASCCRWFGSA